MRPLLAFSRAIDRFNEVVGKAMGLAILLAVLVSAGNAVIRKAFNLSSNSWLELQWYLFGAAFMLAASYTLKQNEHIRIDILYGAFSRRVQHWIDLLGHLFFLLPFVALMSVMMVPYAWRAFANGDISTNAGGLIIWPARAILAFGFIQLTLQALSEIIKKIAVMRGLIDDPHPFVSAHEMAQIEGESLAKELSK